MQLKHRRMFTKKDKKKDYKTIYLKQAKVDTSNFEKISHVQNGKT